MASYVDSRTTVLQEESSKTVLKSHIEPTEDIKSERQRATFNAEELKYFMCGGKGRYLKKLRFCELVEKTDWGDNSQRYFLSREQEYINGLKAAFGIWDLMKNEGLSLKDGAIIRSLMDVPGGLELHIGMFIPTLLSQASTEQQKKWLTPAQDLSIIGTYAQTELGHGTFLRGLQTTATYDPETEEFIIHTPTKTATKWWPGGLGKTATHVVLMARLFIQGVDYGPHGFIVQIRSLDTHKALPGITVGDIGPKFGYNAVDNGYLRFDHVRIPREDMLMRFAKVTPEGRYIKPPPSNAKASYATMIFVRSNLVADAAKVLKKATTISVRYCSVRRQCATQPGMKETQLIDYQNVGSTLIPLIATAYALHFTAISMMKLYREFEKKRDHGDFSILPELHATSSGLKAICSWEAVEGIERCRFCCGGHGYSRLSGLPDLYASYVQNPTWEGDNDVLCLQTGRYLLKAIEAISIGKQIPNKLSYLVNFVKASNQVKCMVREPMDWLNHHACLHALQYRVAFLCKSAKEAICAETGGTLVFDGLPWNNSTVPVIKCAAAHCWYVVLSNFMDVFNDTQLTTELDPSTISVLTQCASLFGLTLVEKYAVDLLESSYITAHQLKMLKTQKNALIKEVRPNAVSLVDSFGYLDYELRSALGRADGDVYKGLLQMAQASPFNKTEEGPAWKPVLEHRLRPRSKI
eukprot:g3712.t1